MDGLYIAFGVIHGVDQRDILADQLRHILIAGGNHRFNAAFGGLSGQRTDNIVSFHIINHQ